MQKPINSFELDEEGHWCAILSCGHTQHVRHDPPFINRPWTQTEEGRQSHVGRLLNCVKCDADALNHSLTKAKTVAVIGGGPAGLMAAEMLSQSGVQVDLYDAMPSVGRKFLLAGKGGLNITHSESTDEFLSRYRDRRTELVPYLNAFGAEALRDWVHALGVDTFVGTSGRVFPVEKKAAPLLRAWLHRLRESGVRFHVRHRWVAGSGFNSGLKFEEPLRFVTPQGEQQVHHDAVILALGGGSWARLGSDGSWVQPLAEQGVAIAPLQAANCGFDVGWSEHFSQRFAGHPLKSIALHFADVSGTVTHKLGECMVTATGLEGSLIYALSARLRDEISVKGEALIQLDLAPAKSLQRLVDELSESRGARSMANHLRVQAGIEGVKAGLLREVLSAEDFADPVRIARAIKSLPLALIAPRPIDEAISSAGGVMFDALDERLMVCNLPGVFCAGEMLDWEAPTGGYLLTACFASGRAAGLGALAWLKENTPVIT